MQIDYNQAIIGTVLFLVVFFIFYLYKHENKYIINILSWQYKTQPAKLEKDTRFEDWIIFILLLVLINSDLSHKR